MTREQRQINELAEILWRASGGNRWTKWETLLELDGEEVRNFKRGAQGLFDVPDEVASAIIVA